MFAWIKTHKLVVSLIALACILGIFRLITSRQVSYEEYSVTKGDLRDTLELSGKIMAGTSASLRFGAGGLITYLGVKEGDSVKQWQTIASVDSRQLQKTLEQKLNLYAIERDEFDQGRDDHQKNINDGDIDQELRRLLAKNQYQLDNTVKDVEYYDLSLKLSRLTSPITGILVHSPIETNNVQVLATDYWLVVDPTSLYFSADLDETDLQRVSIGQKVIITLDAFPDREIISSVLSISYSPKETTTGTTYEVKLTLPPEQIRDLRLGLNGTAAIILSEKTNVPTLPASAFTSVNGSSLVTVKIGNKYVTKTVQTGIENQGIVEIESGLGEQDHVYTKK